jgi:hypothetical protein
MSEEVFENIKSDVLPYDFVKENDVIALNTKEGVIVSSPRYLTKEIYNEIQRFLNSSFKFELCEPEKFNEILTNSFSITDHRR